MSNNVITVDFRRARSAAPLLDPNHIVTIRVGELTRLLFHRYPNGIPVIEDSGRIVAAVLDHLANLANGRVCMEAWIADHIPDLASYVSLDAWEGGGIYWRKGPLGTFISLTIDEARACRIRTIEAKATRRKCQP